MHLRHVAARAHLAPAPRAAVMDIAKWLNTLPVHPVVAVALLGLAAYALLSALVFFTSERATKPAAAAPATSVTGAAKQAANTVADASATAANTVADASATAAKAVARAAEGKTSAAAPGDAADAQDHSENNHPPSPGTPQPLRTAGLINTPDGRRSVRKRHQPTHYSPTM